MRVDRETFLFLAGALWACHAEHRRTEAERVPTEATPPPEPAPESVADASVPSVIDSGSADASSEAAGPDRSDAAAPSPPPTPPKSLTELRRRCAALGKPEPGCPATDTRAHMCRTVLAEFGPAAATRAVECLETIETSCDVCGVRTCVKNALEGLPKRPVAECNSVAKTAEQASEGYGEVMRELCEKYASGMTAVGRSRFTGCLKKHIGVGVRICLWDPSATPCTENFGGPPGLE